MSVSGVFVLFSLFGVFTPEDCQNYSCIYQERTVDADLSMEARYHFKLYADNEQKIKVLERFVPPTYPDGDLVTVKALYVVRKSGERYPTKSKIIDRYNGCFSTNETKEEEKKKCLANIRLGHQFEMGDSLIYEYELKSPYYKNAGFASLVVSHKGQTSKISGAGALQRVRFIVPKGLKIYSGGASPAIETSEDTVTYDWHLDHRENDKAINYWSAVSTGNTWLLYTKGYVEEEARVIAASSPLIEKIGRSIGLREKGIDKFQKLERIRLWMRENIKHFLSVKGGDTDYVFMRNRIEPIEMMVNRGVTDCKGFSAMTRALLQYAEVESLPVLTRLEFEPLGLSETIPTHSEINHVFVYIPEYDWYVDFSHRPKDLRLSILNGVKFRVIRSDTGEVVDLSKVKRPTKQELLDGLAGE